MAATFDEVFGAGVVDTAANANTADPTDNVIVIPASVYSAGAVSTLAWILEQAKAGADLDATAGATNLTLQTRVVGSNVEKIYSLKFTAPSDTVIDGAAKFHENVNDFFTS